MPNPKRGHIKNASIYLISTIISFGISILVLPVYTRLLTPSEYGITLLFIMFGKIVAGFVNFSLHSASYRYYFDYTDDKKGFRILNSSNFFFLVTAFLCTCILAYVTSFLFSSYLFDGQLSGNLLVLSMASAYMDYLFLYMTTLLTAELRAVEFAVATILNMVLNSGFSLFFIVKYHLTYLGRIYGIMLSQVVMVLVLLVLCRKTFIMQFSYAKLKKSLRLTVPYYPQMLLGLSQNYLDRSILSVSKGTASLGFYSVGVNFATVLKMIMDAVEKAWSPFFYTNALKKTEESKKLIVERFYFMAVGYMCLGLCVVYFSEEAIKLLTTKEYYPAIMITPIYVYFYLFAIVGYLTNAQLSVAEKLKYILPGALVSAAVNILFNFLLIPRFGAIGAAFSAAITSLVTQLFLYHYGMKVFPLPLNKYRLIRLYLLLFAFTVPAYLIFQFDLNFFVKIIMKVGLLALFVLVTVWTGFIKKQYILSLISRNKFGQKLASRLNLKM